MLQAREGKKRGGKIYKKRERVTRSSPSVIATSQGQKPARRIFVPVGKAPPFSARGERRKKEKTLEFLSSFHSLACFFFFVCLFSLNLLSPPADGSLHYPRFCFRASSAANGKYDIGETGAGCEGR